MPVLRLDLQCSKKVVIYHGQVVLEDTSIEREKNRKCLNKTIDKGLYEFKEFTPSETEPPRMQKEEDLKGDDLKHYEADIEAIVERLMRGTVQNKLMYDLERNGITFPLVTVNTKFLNCLQPEWLKSKKLEKSQDPLALMAHTGSSFRTISPYYVTHPSLVVDYDDDYQGDAVQNNFEDPLTTTMILLARAITQRFSNPLNNHLRTSSNTRNQAIVQADRVHIQTRNYGNDGRNTRRSYVQEKVIEGNNVQNDAGNIQRTLRTTSSGTAANVQCYNYSEKGHYARNCPKPRVQDSKYFMEQMLLAKQDEAGITKSKSIQSNNTIGDDQIDSNIIFDEPNGDVNSGSVEYDNNVQKSYALKQLARNAYKEKVRVFEMNKGNNTTYFNEYTKADRKAKQFEQKSQSQFIYDRDVIRDLE
ncbi:gag-pol polyprotein [Tanacetum coccineum]|uniref:Gag-pol polyprotein n=1 Tax=Tanacetum coccineum TaxID=301880 RepID=A0ABQ5B9W8_9ASTR